MKFITATLLLLVLCAAVPSAAAAQGGALAGIRGTVVDSLGGPVPHAQITVRHEPTGQTTTVLADADGRYLSANLAAGGPYTVTAQRVGFEPARATGVQLHAGTVHRLDFTVGTRAMTLPGLEVRAATDARFSTERSGAATILDRAAVEAHPTIQRDVMELAALSPMAARTEHGHAIAGQNSRFNAFQLDGARFQDMFGMASDGSPGGVAQARPLPLEAVEQFQVLVAPFDVRHSGFTGGLLNVVTRSGTNQWESSAFGHYRDRSFLGSLDLPGGLGQRPDAFSNAIAGLTFGGPIVRDRAHIFAALELERRTVPSGGYSVGRSDPLSARLSPDSAAALAGILGERFGYDAGELGQLTLDNPRENVFVRADWLLGDGHRLVARHNYAAARRDMEPNRAPTGAYELGAQTYRHTAAAHAGTLQLVSSLARGWSNELLLNVQRIGDSTTPSSTLPLVEVDVRSDLPGLQPLRTVRTGGHYEAQANRLTQTSLELRNALTGAFGAHMLTIGASAELMRFNSLYVANPRGLYRFGSLAALRANEPASFERTLLADDAGDGSVAFSVAHFAGFVQDEWHATSRLTLRAGLRVDAPVLRERPRENTALLESELGVSTATLPRTTPLLSPRVAFNWQTGGTLRTQVRGGAGLFTGRPAYGWLANAYAQTGMNARILHCAGSRAPRLDTGASPTACLGTPAAADLQAAPIVFFSEDFRFPQDLRFALGIDQALPFGLVASADGVIARSTRQIYLRDINLGEAVFEPSHFLGYTDGYGFHLRESYGRPTVAGFEPVRRVPAFNQVIELGEHAHNRAVAGSFELSGAVSRLRFTGSYTYTRSLDVQSLVHRDAVANFGSTVSLKNPNDPYAAHSDFDRPHRVLATVAARLFPARGGTDLSLLYVAESGAPYTYVYAGDINADGYPGSGTQDSFNDPIYVPRSIAEFPGTLSSAIAFERLVEKEPCLRQWREGVLHRNHCRAPANHRLDFRAAQTLRVRGTEVRVIADVLNMLQLLGSERGLVQRVDPRVPLLEPIGRPNVPTEPFPERLELESWYVGGIARDHQTGNVSSLLPYTTDLAASRWQAQIGIELRTGRR